VFSLDDDSVGSASMTSDDVPLSVALDKGSGKTKCSRPSLPPSLLNAARRRVTKSCELSKLDGVDFSCELSSRDDRTSGLVLMASSVSLALASVMTGCPCMLLSLSRIGATVWLFTFLIYWSFEPPNRLSAAIHNGFLT
jgi:hypothetical protein